MNVDEIRKFCLNFPGAKEKLQWGDALCFKIGGKMFAVLGLDDARLTFKCKPDAFAELVERENIRPAPYVGRYKWVILDRLDALRDDELREMVRQSYEMVSAKAPRSGAKKPKSGVKKKNKKSASKKKSDPSAHRARKNRKG
jgi:predicted DNA-binding protein (MmcQ/YjbR family)